MDEDEAPLPEFEEINGNEFLEQMDQENKVAQSERVDDGGDGAGEEGQVLHPPTNWSVIEIYSIDFMCLPCLLCLRFLFSFSNFLSVASVFSVV